jgi:glyoxylase-like metal-dependent hydrolase (beta-lactamase superfamily II)
MPEWQIEELAAGVYARVGTRPLLPNSGIIVGDEGVVVVDSGYSVQGGRDLLADVRRLTPKPVTAIVITHHHFDHAWGNAAFAGVDVIGHANARRALTTI